jgi:hypothetical protein
MRQYAAFSRSEVLAQLAEQKRASHANRPLVEIDFPPDLVKSGTVAVIYDETEGLAFLGGFGEFERAFTAEAVKGYETSFFQTFPMSASSGSLIHATVGSFGGVGRPAKRAGLVA